MVKKISVRAFLELSISLCSQHMYFFSEVSISFSSAALFCEGSSGVSRWKLAFGVGSVILLYSTGNYVFNHLWWNVMEDNVRKRMSMYVWLGHFAVQQKLTEHCKSIIIKIIYIKKKEIKLILGCGGGYCYAFCGRYYYVYWSTFPKYAVSISGSTSEHNVCPVIP